MTRDETRRILDQICKLYLIQAKKLTKNEKQSMLDAWADTFEFDRYEDIDNALRAYVRSGKPFIPNPSDILNMIASEDSASADKTYNETDRLFNTLMKISDIIANNKERSSVIDPGGFRWDPELQRNVYYHPETLISTRSFTQYDFAQLPTEIQEYVGDISGLHHIWLEIQSSCVKAKARFETALPGIKAELAKRGDKNNEENKKRLETLFSKTSYRCQTIY